LNWSPTKVKYFICPTSHYGEDVGSVALESEGRRAAWTAWESGCGV